MLIKGYEGPGQMNSGSLTRKFIFVPYTHRLKVTLHSITSEPAFRR
jgi:hypothetical protein